jgi:hypothetical protein
MLAAARNPLFWVAWRPEEVAPAVKNLLGQRGPTRANGVDRAIELILAARG